ncbi:prepilin-type N-terminal cleavage/methylation domain-containing protein [Myxococcus sp. CA056]|nr:MULTISPECIES: prepilin-type N-terminal cleavage/methylation domain-containing protein [unclassified Myxococcus]NTX12702.1 prepilin-type N-terminal cleavage/methylation domain-containing protein [Myxococcus sp. CA056]NTX33721.1 prepilin-type N-terminal cleavage/methylation domain-containing protein [Myxococcus sp. CA033]NTX54016.1 prepilin-type N-terminal cleavage/methylation domain-containing protein [Myxococcus sp. CA039A]
MLNRLLKKKGGFTLIELMIVVAIIGILAAIAIPNFIRFQAKSKQSEAKTNLKAIFTAQKAYFGEKDKYVSDFKVVGFDPEPGNRFTYAIKAGCAPAAQAVNARQYDQGCIGQDSARFNQAPTVAAPMGKIGVDGNCPNCEFYATAAGNVDNDAFGDTWGITSLATVSTALTNTCGIDPPGTIGGGEPGNAYNDVSCP